MRTLQQLARHDNIEVVTSWLCGLQARGKHLLHAGSCAFADTVQPSQVRQRVCCSESLRAGLPWRLACSLAVAAQRSKP